MPRRTKGSDEEDKWKGSPDEEHTWQPVENLDCETLVNDLEEKRKKERARESAKRGASREVETPDKRTRRSTAGRTGNDKSLEEELDDATKKPREGFYRGLRPDRILSATDASGELMFLMKWLDSDEVDLVAAKEANAKCPEIVIKFYEDRLALAQGQTGT